MELVLLDIEVSLGIYDINLLVVKYQPGRKLSYLPRLIQKTVLQNKML
jgi:hypothetical protein